MKFLVLYPYPKRTEGHSLQGHYLVKGLKECGFEVMACDRSDEIEKRLIYENFRPDAVVGIGIWKDAPDLILHPQKYGMRAVPWFNANGWVANYHELLSELPLLVTTSSWVKSTYVRDGLKGDNIQVCPVGFDSSVFYPASILDEKVKETRRKLGVADGEVMIYTTGGDVTSKGAQEMFRALAEIGGRFSNWKYVLKTLSTFSSYNHGLEERRLIRELGLDEKKFIYVEDDYSPEQMALLVRACDIYAAPSRLEGFGMTQVEAQACGKPVVSINAGGPSDTVVHGRTGFLADAAEEVKLDREWVYPSMGFEEKKQIVFDAPKVFAYRADVGQLANYTYELMSDSVLRAEMGRAAAEHVLEKFHYKKVAEKMVGLIKEFVI